MGRRTKLTPEIQRIIVEGLGRGMWAKDAATLAGVGERTFYRWMQRGENEPGSIYGRFRQAIKEADAACQAQALAAVQRAALADTWQAAAWLLERRHGFVRRDRPEVRVGGTAAASTVDELYEEVAALAPLLSALAASAADG